LRTIAENLDDLALRTAELDRAAGASGARSRIRRPRRSCSLNRRPWRGWRRSVDFYDEGTLIWLEADVTIRKLTSGKRSLDDFCKRFHGAVRAFRKSSLRIRRRRRRSERRRPYDWTAFLTERTTARRRAPMGGIEGAVGV